MPVANRDEVACVSLPRDRVGLTWRSDGRPIRSSRVAVLNVKDVAIAVLREKDGQQ